MIVTHCIPIDIMYVTVRVFWNTRNTDHIHRCILTSKIYVCKPSGRKEEISKKKNLIRLILCVFAVTSIIGF